MRGHGRPIQTLVLYRTTRRENWSLSDHYKHVSGMLQLTHKCRRNYSISLLTFLLAN